MFRFTGAFTTGAGLLLVVPSLTTQDAGARIATLEGALDQTLRALETFTDLSERVEKGDRDAVRAVRTFTEDPIEDERARDERAFELGQQVSQLQGHLDTLEGGLRALSTTAPLYVLGTDLPPELEVNATPAPLTGGSITPDVQSVPHSTDWSTDPMRSGGGPVVDESLLAPNQTAGRPSMSGMDERTRAALLDVRAPGEAKPLAPTQAGPRAEVPTAPIEPVEKEGYSADPLRHARACFRAERFERALEILATMDESAEVLFWTGRALERLERLDEAVATMERASRLDPESLTGRRAAESLEFLVWKRDFVETLPTRPPAGGRP